MGGTIKPKRLTRQQKKLVAAVAQDPDASLTELGERSGYTSRGHVHRALNSSAVKSRLTEALDKLSLDEDRIAKEVEKGLDKSLIEGKHGDYLDRLIALRGHNRKDAEGQTNVAAMFVQVFTAMEDARKAGVIPH